MPDNILSIIFTSAVVSSVFSGIFLFINDHLRRESEEKRFIVEAALKLTKMEDERKGEVAKYLRTNEKMPWPVSEKSFNQFLDKIKNRWKTI